MLAATLVIACLMFVIRFLFVADDAPVYHTDITSWQPDPGNQISWTRFSSVKDSAAYVSYFDRNRDGKIDERSQGNTKGKRVSWDTDHDGYFDYERFQRHGEKGSYNGIHVAVPIAKTHYEPKPKSE